jgi:hypothetical protein
VVLTAWVSGRHSRLMPYRDEDEGIASERQSNHESEASIGERERQIGEHSSSDYSEEVGKDSRKEVKDVGCLRLHLGR